MTTPINRQFAGFSFSAPAMLKTNNGFTTIELVVVIILIGILSVTAVSRFFTSKGYEEYSYRAEAITKLRAIQLKAMQQTHNNECHFLTVESKRLGVDTSNTCTSETSDLTTVTIDADHQVSFSTSGVTSFYFDSMGKPQGNCAGGCILTLQGEETLQIVIESEGYIHAS